MSNNFLFYNSPAKFWTDALPCGNGSIGGMFFCGTSTDRIALNQDTLWTGYPRELKKEGAFEAYKKAQEYALSGNLYSAQEIAKNKILNCWSQAYMPFGDLFIDFGSKLGLVSSYKRSLNIAKAILESTYTKNNIHIEKTGFISNSSDVLVYKITADKKISFSLSLNCKLKSETRVENNIIITDGICPSDSDSFSESYPCNSLIYSDKDEEKGICFRSAVKVVTDGKTSVEGNALSLTGVSKAVIYFAVKTSFNGPFNSPYLNGREYKKLCLDTLQRAIDKGYDSLKEEHIADYEKYYSRVAFTLNKKNDNSSLPTDKRLLAFRNDRTDFELYELLYNYARYLLISSSRENSQATTLQGIWNENIKPAWNSNYTININTEMNYWPVLSSDLPEIMSPLFELIKTISVTGEKTAKDYYNANGFVAHHNTDIWGTSVPISGDTQWGYWCGGSGWLCDNLYKFYEFTLDENYLKSTALPLLRKSAEFYLDILTNDGNGNLIICPSTSPENTFRYNEKKLSVSKTSTIMNTIVLDNLINCRKACDELGINDEFYSRLTDAISKIKPFKIGSKGQLLEWNEEYEECDPHHRHVSHLIGVHPFDIINEKDMPDIFEACKKTLDIRGDEGTGWSLAWKINFHARLKNGNRALKLLNMQLKPVKSLKNSALNFGGGGGTYSNLFDAHPPFQIDGNFGYASGINEMLLQSDGNNIYLLPALPDEWAEGSVKGLRAKGNVKVDFKWKDGKVTDYKIHGENADKMRIVL